MWKINFTIPTIGSPSYPYASFDDTIPGHSHDSPQPLLQKVVLAPNKTKEHKTNNDRLLTI